MTAPTPEPWAEIEALFHDALDAPEAERAALVARGSTPEVRAAVERLLAAHARDATFLERNAIDARGFVDDAAPPTIGGYTLLEVIGEGGMGVVHLARQAHPERLVALKLIRPGFVTPAAIARLRSEATILGRLEHPAIARIYDAGVAPWHGQEQPYLALERIDGVPLTTAVRGRSRRERLEIFLAVCDAVAYAHDQRVLHRDLKPANILVDDGGRPHVLDFGIAQMTDDQTWLATRTEASNVVGTLPYLAPELLASPPHPADEACDVYALGVLLFEVLSDARPHDLDALTLPDALRRIAEDDAPTLGSLDRSLRGDLSVITATALARERGQRYASVAALADDVRAFLAQRPIAARPPSVVYRSRRWTQRHRVAVAGALIVLVSAAAIITIALRRQADARNAAFLETVMADLFAVLEDPNARLDPEQVKELDRLSARLDGAADDRPLGEAAARMTLGDAYLRLGQYRAATTAYQRCAALRESVHGRHHPDTLAALNGVAIAGWRCGADVSVGALLDEVLTGRTELLGAHDRLTLKSQNDYAQFLLADGAREAGLTLLTETLAAQRAHLPEGHADTLTTMQNLVGALRTAERIDEAEALARESLALFRRFHGETEPRTLMAMAGLASLLREAGRPDDARPLYAQYADGLSRVLGPGHPDALIARGNQASFLMEIGAVDDALRHAADAAAHAVDALPEGNDLRLSLQRRHGRALVTAERFDAARPVLERALAEAQRHASPQEERVLRELERLHRKAGNDAERTRYRTLRDAWNAAREESSNESGR